MPNNWIIKQEIDLTYGVHAPQVWPNALMLRGDNDAHTWRVAVRNGRSAAQLTGSITGYFVRPDGNTVAVQGTISGNVASVTLAQACYAVEGNVQAVMRLSTGSITLTLAALILPVRNYLTDSIIDPGDVIPSLDELLAQISACEEATRTANQNEQARASAESARVTAEQNRAAAESQRATAEQSRASAESARVTAEQNRAAAESQRVTAEQGRAALGLSVVDGKLCMTYTE